jgi:hypothetical protein
MIPGNRAITRAFISITRGGRLFIGEHPGTTIRFTIPGIMIIMISGTLDGTTHTILLTITRTGIPVITTAITRPATIPIFSRIR